MQRSTRTIDRARARLEVIVREGLKGHHLLFDAADVAAGARAEPSRTHATAREVARTGLSLASAASIDEARALIAAASPECRSELARLYLAFLGRCASAQGHAS
jgi:hypothetical protein